MHIKIKSLYYTDANVPSTEWQAMSNGNNSRKTLDIPALITLHTANILIHKNSKKAFDNDDHYDDE